GNMFGILPSYGFYLRHVKNISLLDLDISLKSEDMRYAILADDVDGLVLSGIKADLSHDAEPFLKLNESGNVMIESIVSKSGTGTLITNNNNPNIKIRENSIMGFQKIYGDE
ncbi:hypothetical protein ACFLTU_09620, partial [Bacteroidota bacterium]